MSESRYAGKPFLKLVECYLQRAIGMLSPRDAELLGQMTPKLQGTFGREGSWHAIVAAEMRFDDEFDDEVRVEWERARAAGVPAVDFSRMLADKIIEE
jgi:hypothetical protein